MRIAFLLLLFVIAQPLRAQVLDTLWNRGLACFKEENFHGMISYMDTLLKMSPGLGDAYYNRGIAKMNLGNFESACIDLQMAQKTGTNISKEFVEYECNPEFIRKMMVKMFYKNYYRLSRTRIPSPVYPCRHIKGSSATGTYLF